MARPEKPIPNKLMPNNKRQKEKKISSKTRPEKTKQVKKNKARINKSRAKKKRNKLLNLFSAFSSSRLSKKVLFMCSCQLWQNKVKELIVLGKN